jgi:peptidoglycan LD-endopeptidase LytH
MGKLHLVFPVDRVRVFAELPGIMTSPRPLHLAALLLSGLVLWVMAAGASSPWAADATEETGAEVSTATPAAAAVLADSPPPAGTLSALRTAPTVSPPYVERALLRPGGEGGLGYRVALRAGDTLRVAVEGGAVRLHAYPAAEIALPDPVILAGSRGEGQLELVADRSGDVVILLHGAPGGDVLTVRLDRSGALVFPVAGKGPEDVLSHFLDSRDGGRRAHHGVDIAAPRGNPVRAVADGTIERVETTPVGGLTVRLVEARTGHVHYFAHLSSAFVKAGDRVVAGQTLGGVGNTGNARNTPPHLHYAVFDGRAILDPIRILVPAPTTFDDPPSPRLGTQARTRVAGAAVRPAPVSVGPARTLELDQPVLILSEIGRYYRIRTEGIGEGYVAKWVVD